MVLGKLPVPGRPTIWITIGQGPTALAVSAGGDGLDIFTLIYSFSPRSPFLRETARYRLKYCLKGPLNPKQPTNQIDKISTRTCIFDAAEIFKQNFNRNCKQTRLHKKSLGLFTLLLRGLKHNCA